MRAPRSGRSGGESADDESEASRCEVAARASACHRCGGKGVGKVGMCMCVRSERVSVGKTRSGRK